MIATANYNAARPTMLRSSTAAEIMTLNPLAFDEHDSLHKVAALLHFHELDAAPVVDFSGRLVGTISAQACADWEEYSRRTSPHGFSAADLDETDISEIVVPLANAVRDDLPAREAIDALRRCKARQMYVVDRNGELLGAIGLSDVRRRFGELGGVRRVSSAAAAQLS